MGGSEVERGRGSGGPLWLWGYRRVPCTGPEGTLAQDRAVDRVQRRPANGLGMP